MHTERIFFLSFATVSSVRFESMEPGDSGRERSNPVRRQKRQNYSALSSFLSCLRRFQRLRIRCVASCREEDRRCCRLLAAKIVEGNRTVPRNHVETNGAAETKEITHSIVPPSLGMHFPPVGCASNSLAASLFNCSSYSAIMRERQEKSARE